MERKDVNTLYSNIFEQLGGGKSPSQKNKKNDFYIPSDLSLKSQGICLNYLRLIVFYKKN